MEERVKQILRKYINSDEEYDIFIEWECKVLDHSRWLFSTSLDDKFYEVTYSGITDVLYIDVRDRVYGAEIRNPFNNKKRLI